MIALQRTNAASRDFLKLVSLLDKDLAWRDGCEHDFYATFNKLDSIKNVVLLYSNHEVASCGAYKKYNEDTVEIKRMFTLQSFRGRGYALLVLKELEKWAAENAYRYCILETGKKQPEAIALYTKAGYLVMSNYGQYQGVENSVCMKKML